jgi:hypothetical protein
MPVGKMAVSAQYGKAVLLRSFACGKTPYPRKKMTVSIRERNDKKLPRVGK